MEIQRCANIVPTGVLHISQNDFTINDITIPAYTLINPLMTNILKVFKLSFSFFFRDILYIMLKSYLGQSLERWARIQARKVS